MHYLSKITPFFFVKAFVFLGLSLFLRHSQDWTLFVLLLIYGFVGSMLVGAMYQIVTNSQNRKLFLPQLSYLTFFLNIIKFQGCPKVLLCKAVFRITDATLLLHNYH